MRHLPPPALLVCLHGALQPACSVRVQGLQSVFGSLSWLECLSRNTKELGTLPLLRQFPLFLLDLLLYPGQFFL